MEDNLISRLEQLKTEFQTAQAKLGVWRSNSPACVKPCRGSAERFAAIFILKEKD
jgi:hypothetical protein